MPISGHFWYNIPWDSNRLWWAFGLRKGGAFTMNTFQTLMVLFSFGMFIIALLSYLKSK